jgi:hypothetical protein
MERVVALAASQGIIAVIAPKIVVPRSAQKKVVPFVAVQRVVAGTAVDRVAAIGAREQLIVSVAGAGRSLGIRCERGAEVERIELTGRHILQTQEADPALRRVASTKSTWIRVSGPSAMARKWPVVNGFEIWSQPEK